VRLEQGEQALRAILMDVPTRVFLPRMVDELVYVALQRAIAARRVGIQPAACLHSQIRGLLDRLDGEIAGGLDDDRPLAADPRNDGRAIFLVVPSAGLTLLAAPPWSAPQRLWATLRGLALLARGVIEVIRFHRPLQPAIGFIRNGRITQPPAPTIARPA